MDTKERVRIIESQINSERANFTLLEKMKYLSEYFDKDIEYKEATNIVRGNISKGLSLRNI